MAAPWTCDENVSGNTTSRSGDESSCTPPSDVTFARLLTAELRVLLSWLPELAASCSAAAPQAMVPPLGVVMTPEVCPAAM